MAAFFASNGEIHIVGIEHLHGVCALIPRTVAIDGVDAVARTDARGIMRAIRRHRPAAAFFFPATHLAPQNPSIVMMK